ncbi:hypothetical protein [Staphylococcus cohnii]
MEWIHVLSKYWQNIGGVITILGPLIYFIYSYYERRVLTNKLDKFFTLFTIFLVNILIYSLFTYLLFVQAYYNSNWQLFNFNSYSMILLGVSLFLLFISLMVEMLYQSKLRIAFTLMKISNISGLLIKQKIVDSQRIVKYQILADNLEEKDIVQFYRKKYREIGMSVTEEYIENNYFVSDSIYRLKNISVFNKRISLLVIDAVRWFLILLIGIVGLIIMPKFELNNAWIFGFLILMAIITMIKNIVCMKAVNISNEKLMKEEYKKWCD